MADYFEKALKLTNGELIETMRYQLRDLEYDTIVGTGLSGTIFVARVAPGLRKKFAIVRKDNDGSHSGFKVEGSVGKRWVFADDFVCTGDTMKRVLKRMVKDHPGSEFVGVYQYEPETFSDADRSADLFGSWVVDIAFGGPRLGPKTYEEMKEEAWMGSIILRAPRGGWDPSVMHLVPLPGWNMMELDYAIDGVPCFWNLEQGCRIWGTDKRVRLLAEQISVSLLKDGTYNRFVGCRIDTVIREVNKYPEAAALRSWTGPMMKAAQGSR